VPGAQGTVVLVGDSNAGHFTEPAAAGANAAGFDFTVRTFPDCPFVDLRVTPAGHGGTGPECRRFVAASLAGMVAAPPALVILAASGPIYLTSDATFQDPRTGRTATTATSKAAMWTVGLRRALERLHAAGVPAVVVHTVPQWRVWDPRDCANALVYLAPHRCGADQSRAEVDAFRSASIAADDAALRAVPGTASVDFLHDLCPRDCRTNRGDFWIYRDGRHLSVAGARRLTARFQAIVEAHAQP
jgi:lysophospholipase L1-like esterase